MKQSTYHELNPLVRLRNWELLTPEIYGANVKAENMEEVGTLLEERFMANI